MTRFALIWNRLPTILAFALLVFQAAIPWTARHFVTHDGASHLYTAVVARDLLLHGHSNYRSVYQLQRHIVPNWGTTIGLGLAASVVGVDHAEQLFASFAAAAGFFAFSYAVRALAPESSPWTPLANFLLQTWFLWIGYYNFYLGMALLPFLIGFYVKRMERLTPKAALAIAGGLAVLFFIHIIPAALGALTLFSIAVWVRAISGFRAFAGAWRELGLLVATLIPALLLMAVYARQANTPIQFKPDIAAAWNAFPLHVFSTGHTGQGSMLWPAILFYIAIATLSMRRSEWRSPRGGLVVAALLAMLLYLLVPDRGFGGSEAKIRFSFAVFLLGGIVAASVRRLRSFRTPVAIYIGCFLASSFAGSASVVRASSEVIDDYLAATDHSAKSTVRPATLSEPRRGGALRPAGYWT